MQSGGGISCTCIVQGNNQEEDTANIIKLAMEKLNEARPQSKLIRKMIKAMEPNSIPAEHNVDPAPLDG